MIDFFRNSDGERDGVQRLLGGGNRVLGRRPPLHVPGVQSDQIVSNQISLNLVTLIIPDPPRQRYGRKSSRLSAHSGPLSHGSSGEGQRDRGGRLQRGES